MIDPVAFMSRHFIALTCDYETVKWDGSVERRGVSVYSGFLLELHGVMFWVTAGHCIKHELDAGIASGQLRITSGSFMDCFGHEATFPHSIPYRYEPGCGYYIEKPEHGLDFALIPMNYLQVKAFAANKLIPITRDNWVHQPHLTFDFYRMLGTPKERVITTERPDGTLDTKVGQAMVALNKIGLDEVGDPPPDMDEEPSNAWFIGRLDPECTISDIAGMSGGPIYGFRRDKNNNLVYHVVALQSRWWWKSRTIFGCSMTVFAEEIHRQLGEIIADRGNGNEQTTL